MDANPPERRHPADTLTPTPHPCDGDTTMNFRTATPHPTRRIALAALVGLTWTGMGFRNLSNSKRSVTKLEDVGGLKIRVMANPVALDTWKTIGANAVPMAFAEVFPALEIKALDGQENPLLHMY